jgi:DNA invertase Pin-like site-specific DNA recombinase
VQRGIYLRVNTGDQTVENQRQALIEAATHRGWRVVEEFVDSGVSGAKGRDKRPAFDRLCKAVTRRKIDVVAAWSVDRLGRSLQDLVGFLGELNGAGCDLYLERQAVDTTTPAGRLFFRCSGYLPNSSGRSFRDGSMPVSPGRARKAPRAEGRLAGHGSTRRSRMQSAPR